MKLSEKGVEKVSRNCKNVMVIGTDDFFPPTILEGAENLEFDQSDFTGAVVLTVEEAEGIYETINEAKAFLWNRHGIPLSKAGQKDFDTLRERIKQAEGKNESN